MYYSIPICLACCCIVVCCICSTTKHIVYFQDIPDAVLNPPHIPQSVYSPPKIRLDDLRAITLFSQETAHENRSNIAVGQRPAIYQGQSSDYLVDQNVRLLWHSSSNRKAVRFNLDISAMPAPYVCLLRGDVLYVEPNKPRLCRSKLRT